MGRRDSGLEHLSTPADAMRFVIEHDGTCERCGTNHIKGKNRDGNTIAVWSDHKREFGPHTRSALRRALAALLLVLPLICGLAYLVMVK